VLKPMPMIALTDVEAGSRWFQNVLGVTSAHGGPDYDVLVDGREGVVQLHRWEADEHAHLGNVHDPSRGNGVLLWYSTDDFDAAYARVTDADAEILDGPLFNPNARHRELWLRGPEGYVVVVSGPRESG
jgi:hypothetical protein